MQLTEREQSLVERALLMWRMHDTIGGNRIPDHELLTSYPHLTLDDLRDVRTLAQKELERYG